MSANGGLGAVIGSGVNLIPKSAEKITAVKSENCEAIWVISYSSQSGVDYNLDTFYAFEVTSAGVNTVPVKSNTSALIGDGKGYLKVSSMGNKLAIAHQDDRSAYLYSFDVATGVVSNGVKLNFPVANEMYGVEFSLDEKRLYVTTHKDLLNNRKYDGYLYQFDLDAAVPENSAIEINARYNDLYRSALQMGPDGKIYRTMPKYYGAGGGSSYLSVIQNPDVLGLACNYVENAVFLGSGQGAQGLPPFIQSIFNTTVDIVHNANLNNNVVNICEGDTYKLYVDATGYPASTTYQWSENGVVIPETGTEITVDSNGVYKGGLYELEIDPNDGTCPQRGSAIVNFYTPPVFNSVNNWYVCDSDNDGYYVFDLSSLEGVILGGQSATDYEVSFYLNQADADQGQNAVSKSFTNTVAYQQQTLYVRVQHHIATQCYTTGSFSVDVFDTPLINTLPDFAVCDDTASGSDTDGLAVFDLTGQNSVVLGSQNTAQFTITYHLSQADADARTNPLPLSYTNTSSPQTLYVRMENIDHTDCYTTSTFDLVVHPLPVVTSSAVQLEQCDDDTDGYAAFNLTEANVLLSANYQQETFVYYPTQSDALAQTNAIANPTAYTNPTVTTSSVWAEVTNASGCSRIKEVALQVVTTQIPPTTMISLIQCDDFAVDNDDTNGITAFDLTPAQSQIAALFPNPQDLNITFYQNMADALSEQNAIIDLQNYRNESSPFTQLLTVRVDNKYYNACVGLGEHITLQVSSTPQFEIVAPAVVCLNEPAVTLSATTDGKLYDYLWTDDQGNSLGTNPTLDITQGGDYSLTLTVQGSTGCDKTKTVYVEPSQESLLTTQDLAYSQFEYNNTLTIPTGTQYGIGDYQYALSPSGPFTAEPHFEGLTGGSYILYVEDLKGCRLHQVPFTIVEYMRFFTPNGDGYNDTWNLLGADLAPDAELQIFDRYGKHLATIDPMGSGWDGTYNGQPMPSTDYWFTIKLSDGTSHKGHFSLIRK